MVNDCHLGQGKAYVTRPYSAVLGGLGRSGPLYRRIFMTIDYEGLYDGAIGIPTREIARAPSLSNAPIPIAPSVSST